MDTVVTASWAGQHETHSPEPWPSHMRVGLSFTKSWDFPMITMLLGSWTQKLGFLEEKGTIRELVDPSVPPGDQSPGWAKEEAQVHKTCSWSPTAHRGLQGPGIPSQGPFSSKLTLVPHSCSAEGQKSLPMSESFSLVPPIQTRQRRV